MLRAIAISTLLGVAFQATCAFGQGTSGFAEGVVYPFAEGAQFAWSLSNGSYMIVVTALSNGSTVHWKDLGLYYGAPENHSIIPNGFTALHFSVNGTQSNRLDVLRGHGHLIVARPDIEGGIEKQSRLVSDALEVGKCRAYTLHPGGQTNTTITLDGPSLDFSYYTENNMNMPQETAASHLQVTVDSRKIPLAIVQACNPGSHAASFTVSSTVSPRESQPPSDTSMRNLVPGENPLIIGLIVIGFAAALSRLRP